MAGVSKKHRHFKLQLEGSLVLFALLALPVLGSSALAQDAGMRSAIDPESPLASPLGKTSTKMRPKNVQQTAANPQENDPADAQSDADVEAETAGGIKPKPKSTSLSGIEPDSDDLTLVEKTETGKTPVKKGSKSAVKANGKTTIDPGLDAQTTGTLVVRKGQNSQMLRAQPAVPTEAIQSRDLTEEENPFRAVGIRVGSITLRPTLEQGIEVTGSGGSGGRSTTNAITTMRLDGASDWRNGSLETTGFLTLRRAFSGDSTFDPEAGASLKLTQPILRDWSYTIGGSYGLKRENAFSGSAFPTTFAKRPLAQDIRLSLGAGKSEGLFQPSAKVEIGRVTYGNATDSLGALVSQSDRDQTNLRGTLRLGAELSPALTPFVEVAYGKTWRDDAVDVFGNDRSSTDLRASVGAEINLSEKLNGEFSVGWLRQSYDSAALSDIDGVALTAALNWSPQQGTIVSAGLSTSAEPTNSATVSGSMLYAANFGVTHQVSSRLSTSANFGASYREFTGFGGTDTTLSAELAATYWVNRMLGVNAKAKYETVSSSDAMRESDTTTLLLGLNIQR